MTISAEKQELKRRQRVNWIKAATFGRPDHIPVSCGINPSCWNFYPHEALKGLMAEHKLLFPEYEYDAAPFRPEYSPGCRKDKPYIDGWGCKWVTTTDGILGTVHEHPLSDLSRLDTMTIPDPDKHNGFVPIDWPKVENELRDAKEKGFFIVASIPHGHTFLRMCDLCGYENFLMAMADADPRIEQLLEIVCSFNCKVLSHYFEVGVDVTSIGEDLGMQIGPMLSPSQFRKYIKPCYRRYVDLARKHGSIVHMHSDGDLRELVTDMLDAGIDVLNMQDLVNGIEWIASNLKGRCCIDLDIDRQDITINGSPDDIDKLIRKEVEMLGSKEGGLMLLHGVYPPMPLENIKAVMDAMEKYAVYYS